MSTLSTYFVLPDGAKIAYQVLNLTSDHEDTEKTPLVMVNGLNSLGQDFKKLSEEIAKGRPVLIFDNRGIGNSTFSQTLGKNDNVSIESMARDLLALITNIGWKELAILGFSMGGTIVQQLLLLPYHPNNPTPIPFGITRVILTATMASPLKEFRYKIKLPPPPKRTLSHEEKREQVRDMVEHFFDPGWVGDAKNAERLEWWLNRIVVGRPFETFRKQLRATAKFHFHNQDAQIPRSLPILLIHGRLDDIVPFPNSAEILQNIPWVQKVEIGKERGKIPHDMFGHMWWEYFEIGVWGDVLNMFLDQDQTTEKVYSRL